MVFMATSKNYAQKKESNCKEKDLYKLKLIFISIEYEQILDTKSSLARNYLIYILAFT